MRVPVVSYIFLAGVIPLAVELTYNDIGTALWNADYRLTNGALPGHSRTVTNILVNSRVNNTEYICVSHLS